MNGVLAFNISSRTSLDIIVVALEEIAQDQLEFVVEGNCLLMAICI